MQYLVVVEKGDSGYGAFVPDVEGVFATGATVKEVTERMQEALQAHIDWLLRDNEAVPLPSCSAGCVEVVV
jgi:predicted RNase H-like HicB family nuclease